MTKDEIINKLIRATGKEIDYWLLESNRTAREAQYGFVVYKVMSERFTKLRSEVLDAVFSLTEILKEEDEAKTK